uniref:Uncharacterized protein n=3 Tax=Cercopithecinae TaxID=9528 RepID=A0A2K5KZF8_CERAT|nr:unnamed protein product [Macaca fascicularis]
MKMLRGLLGSFKAFKNTWELVCHFRGCQPKDKRDVKLPPKQGACLVSLVLAIA